MGNKKLILVGLVILVSVGSIWAVNRARAIGMASVFFEPILATLPPGQDVNLKIDTGATPIGFARVQVDFDPTLVQLTKEIQTGVSLGNIVSKTTMDQANATGHLTIVAALSLEQRNNPPSGQIGLAILSFGVVTTQTNQSASLNINLEGSQVAGIDATAVDLTKQDATLNLNPVIPTMTPSPTPVPLPVASLNLVEVNSPIVNGEWKVNLIVDTPVDIAGVDAVVTFDPSKLELNRIEDALLLGGATWSQIDNVNGKLKVSQTISPTGRFGGRGTVVTLVFVPKTSGSTSLDWVYTQGLLNDSNVISSTDGRDILLAPANLTTTIAGQPKLVVKLKTASANQILGFSSNGVVKDEGGSWQATFQTDIAGQSGQLAMNESSTGKTLVLFVKVPGYLKRKSGLMVNPEVNTVDFGSLLAGDLNDDGIVNTVDLAILYKQWFSGSEGDYNRDGVINSADYWYLVKNYFLTDD